MRLMLAVPLALATSIAIAQNSPAVASVEELKVAYLDCEHRASKALLDTADAARCSLVYEALKQRAFGGDWTRLLTWWHGQRPAPSAAMPHGPAPR
jgi:hypothetical protein